jgi:hypothetical protein
MGTRFFQSALAESFKFESKGEIFEGMIEDMGYRQIKDKEVPYMTLLKEDGTLVEALMSSYALRKIYFSPTLRQGGYIQIRYDGESKTIESAGNFAKLFSVCYFAPGSYKFLDDGMIDGKPTTIILAADAKAGPDLIDPKTSRPSWMNVEEDPTPIDFEKPVTEDVPQAHSKKKPAKA